MDKKQIAEVLNQIVQREVAKQLSIMKLQLMSEVAGMLQYSERTMLQKIDESRERRSTSVNRMTDYDRVQENLRKMPGYRDKLPQAAQPRTRSQPSKRQYANDSMLNDILNDTSELTEMASSQYDIGSVISFDRTDPQYDEPWGKVAPPAIRPNRESRPVRTQSVPTELVGTDGKSIDLQNETVKNVLDIISNTDYRAKFKKMNEAGDRFRDMNVAPPRYDSDYFDKSTV